MEKGREARLWRWFSKYIRLRDADDQGICKCFTCGRVKHWKQMDCGHGIGRQYKATKYDEKNNHAQCKRCNGFEEGRKDIYSKRVNQLYGEGTWERLQILSKATCKRTQFEIDTLCDYYKGKVKELETKITKL